MATKYIERREWPPYLRERWGLRYSASTFQKMATVGGGPRYAIAGNRAVSTHAWLDEWAEAKVSAPRRSTSEAA
jgi:hypothetical protein